MYNVSQEYKDELHKAVYRFDLSGRLTGTGDFYGDNILAGSLSITNQCSNGDRIVIGSVYVGELRATFVNTNDIQVGATITLTESMYVDELDRFEDVPMGAFKVSEAVKTRSGIQVVAYDYMSKFDKKAELAEVSGTVFEWLRYCCSMCGVTMAQTEQEISALPNGHIPLTCYLPEDFTCTYRDVVSYLAQVIGGFATMDRQGRVKLVSYAPTERVMDIDVTGRYDDGTFSVSPMLFDGITFLYTAGEEEEVCGIEGTSEETTFALGFNPFLQNRTDAEMMMVNLLERVIYSMQYTPFQIRVASGAAYDLGDIITQSGGRVPEPTTSQFYITNITWKYNSGTTLGGAGKNVSISGGGGSSGGGGGGASGGAGAGAMRFYSFTNAHAINILDGTYEKIVDIQFVSKKATTVIFQAEILLDVDVVSGQTLAVAKAKYELNGTEDTTYYPTESWSEEGKHILHLLYFIPIEGEGTYRLTVNLEMTNGDTDIGAQQVRAYVYGQGLAAQEAEWDGTINVEDNLYGYEADITGITSIGDMSAAVTVAQDTPHTRALSDTVEAVDIDGVDVAGMSDTLAINKEPLTTLIWLEVEDYTWGQVSDGFTW